MTAAAAAPGGGGIPLQAHKTPHHDNAEHLDDVVIDALDSSPEEHPSDEKEEGTSNIAGATFNFLNSIVGAGIIGLPYALNAAGLWLGILLLLVVAGLADYSSRLLVRAGSAEGLLSYQAPAPPLPPLALRAPPLTRGGGQGLMEGALGVWGRGAATACMFLFSVGAMFAYLLVIGDTVPVVLAHWLGPRHPLANRELTLALVACLVVLPLCLRRRISKLAWSSAVSMACALLIVVIVCARAPPAARAAGITVEGTQDALSFAHPSLFQAFGVMAFAFVSHHVVFIIFNSLRRGARTEAGWRLVTHASVLSAFLLCASLAVVGYLSFLDTTHADILRNFPSDDAAINAVRLVLALHVAFVYPVEFFVCRESVRSAWALFKQRRAGPGAGPEQERAAEEMPYAQHAALTVGLFAASLAFALAVSDLGIVLELTGGLSAVGLGFILPAAAALRLDRSARARSRPSREVPLAKIPASEGEEEGAAAAGAGFVATGADRALCAALVLVGAFGGISSVSSAIRARL
eukprot:tig00021319_g20219.t1